MQSPKQYSSHNNLPEAVTEFGASGHKYSVPSYVTHHDSQKEVVFQDSGQKNTARRQRWTRWHFFLLYGIFIAIIAGVIGGFVGRAIVDKHKDHPSPSADCSTPTPSLVPTSTNTSSIDSVACILPIPTTGCPSITDQQYMPSTSNNSRIQYTMMCSTRWTNAHLVAISAATPSDCIEACDSYNDNAPADRTCLGASFVPKWWNQTRAMGDKNAPFNCFLMGQNDKIEKNKLGFEIVALCLEDACKDKMGF